MADSDITIEMLKSIRSELRDFRQETSDFRQETNQRFGGVEDRLGSVEGRLGGVEGRLGGVEGRLGGVEGRLGGVEHRLEVLDERLELTNERLDIGNQRLDVIESTLLTVARRQRAMANWSARARKTSRRLPPGLAISRRASASSKRGKRRGSVRGRVITSRPGHASSFRRPRYAHELRR